jgi:uncharacterized protein (DUF924 family)
MDAFGSREKLAEIAPIGPDDVLHFWFPRQTTTTVAAKADRERWFNGTKELDQEIERRFGEAIEQAGAGRLDHWKRHPRGRLALIILLDQFPRNTFRGTATAFSFGRSAVALCLEGLETRSDVQLTATERLFFYLPLLHSEWLSDQERSVQCFRSLSADATGEDRQYFANWVRITVRQRAIIRHFGRFPHRNAILGRRTSFAEMLFLRQNWLRHSAIRHWRRFMGDGGKAAG